MSEPTQRLLKAQRNELYEIVASSGFSPQEFEWAEREGDFAGISPVGVPVLIHKPSGYFFAIAQKDQGLRPDVYGDFMVQEAPGFASAISRSRGYDWSLVVINFRDWLDRIRLDAEQPDLWSAVESSGALIKSIGTRDVAFADSDREMLRNGFRTLLNEIQQQGRLTATQIDGLEQFLVEAGEATERLNPKDWKNALIGGFVGWVFSAAISPDVAKGIFDQILGILSPLFGVHLIAR